MDTAIQVLDHGYVKLINSMGTEESIIASARMSTSGAFVSWEPYEKHPNGDAGLLEYLYKNQHMSPFEMCELVIEVQAPIFVAREWMRHRTQSFNEYSARYSQMLNLHYVPDASRISNENLNYLIFPELSLNEFINVVRKDISLEQASIYNDYEWYLDKGIPKELARINTPVSRYTRFLAKANLRNWLHFLELRLPKNAQWEIRKFAEAVATLIKTLWPRTYKLFEEYTLYGIRFSSTEVSIIRNLLNPAIADDKHLKLLINALISLTPNLSKNKRKVFLEKLLGKEIDENTFVTDDTSSAKTADKFTDISSSS